LLISSTLGFSKRRRSVSPMFSLSGNENVDQLDELLAMVTNGTVDDIEAAILANMGEDFGLGRRDKITTEFQERKFRNLKILVLFLQAEKKFGKYCYYGCHCLPEGSHDLAQGGFGVPKDNIDKSCRRFGQCYKCLLEEHKDDEFNISGNTVCKGEEIGYQVDLIDDVNGFNGRSIICLNKPGSCRRNICECDKQLAESLAQYESEWVETYHSRRGDFERESECEVPQGPSGAQFEECCGDRTTFPLNEPRNSAQCCDGPKSYPNGQC